VQEKLTVVLQLLRVDVFSRVDNVTLRKLLKSLCAYNSRIASLPPRVIVFLEGKFVVID